MNKLILFALLISANTFGQKEHSCEYTKKATHSSLKSNALSISQIAETEKYDVKHYFLDLSMNNLVTTVAGSNTLLAQARTNIDSALLELYSSLTVDSVSLDGISTTYLRTGSILKVPVNKNQNDFFSIKIWYHGTPPSGATNPLGGGGMTNQSSQSWGNQVTWSLSEPFSAYEWFPVKQSLKDKIDSVDFHITVPITCKAGSNGLLQQVVNLGNGQQRFEWKHKHLIDYYLISVAVAEYVEYNITANPVGSGPVLIQNYIYNNPQTLPNFQTRIDETVDFMELFATLFGPYPFANEKYGHCMAPISGGMEHQTMTTQGFFEKGLTSHELGHQWWGNNVTCNSWADIWVNEGFASYSAHLMLENLYPNEAAQDMFDIHDNVMSNLSGSVWCPDSLNEGRIFSGRLTYDKGAAIIHTLRYLINNDSLFFATLKQFQTQYTHGTASGNDFFEVTENVSGVSLTEFAEQWYFGEGFPTYNVIWNTNASDLLIKINQTTSMPSVTPIYTNPIDLKLTRSGLSDTIIRFEINGTENHFVLPNGTSYTNITAIDPENWVVNGQGTIVKDINYLTISENQFVENSVIIYPNPTEGSVAIRTNEDGNNHLVILDTKGKLVLEKDFTSEIFVSLDEKSSGTYLFQISNSATGKVSRILVKK